MKQKILKLLSIALFAILCNDAYAYDFMHKRIAYNINQDGKTCTVTYDKTNNGQPTPTYSGNIKIPNEIHHKGKNLIVSAVGNGAFMNCRNLLSINLPNSIKSIEDDAFIFCTKIEEIIIPSSVTQITKNPFLGCKSLEKITVNKTNSIYDSRDNCNAVIETKTNKLITGCYTTNIPNSIITIGTGAFWNCKNLKQIIIPNSIKAIEESAFYGCNNLTSIKIADLTNWCNIKFKGSILQKPGSIYLNNQPIINLYIPEGVTKVNDFAFYNCQNIKSIILSNSIVYIGKKSFFNCKNLTLISTTKQVPPTINNSFSTFTALIQIPAGCLSAYRNSKEWSVFQNFEEFKDDTKSISSSNNSNSTSYNKQEVKNLSPNELKKSEKSDKNKVNHKADNSNNIIFSFNNANKTASVIGIDNSSAKAINIPSKTTNNGVTYSVVSILKAFKNNKELESITIPNSITSISDEAFYECSNLKSIIIPNSVKNIGKHAFYGCSDLISITIPNSVTQIGQEAFAECTNLTEVKISDSLNTIGNSAFSGCKKLAFIHISNLENWCKVKSNSAILQIPGIIYLNNSIITNLVISEGIQTINDYAFYNCSNIENIVLPKSLNQIGFKAFYNCSNLASIKSLSTVPPTINNSFSNSNMKIFVPDGLMQTYKKSNGWNTFNNYEDGSYFILHNLKFHLNSTENTASLIDNTDKSISKVIIPSRIKYNGKIYTVTSIENVFTDCVNLQTATIPNTITSIGDQAFMGCINLTNISIPKSVTDIGNYAFHNCTKLKGVNIQSETPPTIGTNAFLPDVIISVPEGSKEDYINDFYWNSFNIKEGIFSKNSENATYHMHIIKR